MTSFYTEPRTIQKHVSESFNISFDFTDYLPDGVTLSSVAVTALRVFDNKADTSVVGSFALLGGNLIAKGLVQAGEAGQRYAIRCTATASSAEIFVLVTELLVSNEFTT
jgi:hypothetical protein